MFPSPPNSYARFFFYAKELSDQYPFETHTVRWHDITMHHRGTTGTTRFSIWADDNSPDNFSVNDSTADGPQEATTRRPVTKKSADEDTKGGEGGKAFSA